METIGVHNKSVTEEIEPSELVKSAQGMEQLIMAEGSRWQRPCHGIANIIRKAACTCKKQTEKPIQTDPGMRQSRYEGMAQIDKKRMHAEVLLANTEQEPSDFLLDALFPVMKGLRAEALLKHSNEDVRVTVASCHSEILRISSPGQPFDDDQMKASFQLIVEALSKLSQPSTPCYEKALSLLATFARVKACLLMLDLECEALVLQMCQHFWVIVRSNPSADAFWAVEQIMTDVLTESEDISPDLLHPLLASVLKENEKEAPSCWKLGEKLFSKCAAKLRPILRGALKAKGTTLDDYSPVVASIYQDEISVSRSDLSAMPAVSSRKRRGALKSDVERARDEATLVPRDLRDKKMRLSTRGRSNPSEGPSGI